MQGRDRIKTGPMRPGIRFAILSPVARTPLPFLVGGSVHIVSISESLRPADPLNTIRPMNVQRSLNAMHEAGIAVSTLKDGLVQMRDCMEYALANQLIRTNPCIVIEIPWAVPKSEEEIALTQEEQNDFLSYMDDNWYKELFYFMCLSGVRVGEAGALKWSDVDFEKKTVRIRGSLSCQYCEGVKHMMITSPKTINSIRTIPFLGEMEVRRLIVKAGRMSKMMSRLFLLVSADRKASGCACGGIKFNQNLSDSVSDSPKSCVFPNFKKAVFLIIFKNKKI